MPRLGRAERQHLSQEAQRDANIRVEVAHLHVRLVRPTASRVRNHHLGAVGVCTESIVNTLIFAKLSLVAVSAALLRFARARANSDGLAAFATVQN